MRKISLTQILVGISSLTLAITLSLGCVYLLSRWIPFWTLEFDLKNALAVGLLIFALGALNLRLFMWFFPLQPGFLEPGSRNEFIYHVYVLHLLHFFYPLVGHMILVPYLRRLVYQAFGAQLGPNTFPAGLLHDPTFITIGANGIIGEGSLLIPHLLNSKEISLYPIRLGDNVTVGVQSVVYGGVTIGDGAVVAAMSVVKGHTVIGPGEVWGGIPAKKIRDQL